MKEPKYSKIYEYILAFKELLPRILIASLKGIIIITDNNKLYFINKKSFNNDKILIFNTLLINNNIEK